MTDTRITISELAARSGLSKHTLRYYERIGLMPLVDRDRSSKHRRYLVEHVQWALFVRELRKTGMPIREVRAYAKLAVRRDASWPARRAMLAAHRKRVRDSIARLQGHVTVLDAKIESGCGPERHSGATIETGGAHFEGAGNDQMAPSQ